MYWFDQNLCYGRNRKSNKHKLLVGVNDGGYWADDGRRVQRDQVDFLAAQVVGKHAEEDGSYDLAAKEGHLRIRQRRSARAQAPARYIELNQMKQL